MVDRFPWAGHLGLVMLPQVVQAIEESRSTLVFTNTRNQAESWYQAILGARPDWAGVLALHHGSLAAETRAWVEDGLRDGRLTAVVATASLDLGVDFSPVDRVLQIGSPKGIARLLQRAGRSGHQPGALSRVSCVPTNALELVEAAAARDAAEGGRVEPRLPLAKPLDVLVQHLVTVGLGGGFEPEALLAEVRTAYGYRDLSDAEWQWALDFVVNGGGALGAYPEYRRLALVDGQYRVVDKDIAQRHRLSIGTITSDPVIEVKYLRGPSLGSTSESFISRLKPGDRFIFAGTPLEFVRVHDMTAWVRRASSTKGAIPTWTGTGLPISQELSDAVLVKLGEARDGRLDGPEMQAVAPVLRVQMKVSTLPAPGELLIERVKTREGYHLFFYPFAGKLVNAGLAALFAYRLSRLQPITFTTTANDYGFELLADEKPGFSERPGFFGVLLFATDTLLDDILASMNAGEMAKRQFREIARVAGLVFQGFPGRHHPARHLQASSSLFYEVFQKYDEGNLLLEQAQREVLARQLEQSRLTRILERLQEGKVVLKDVARVTPLGFPLMVERMETSLQLRVAARADRADDAGVGEMGGQRMNQAESQAPGRDAAFELAGERCRPDARGRALLAGRGAAGDRGPTLRQGRILPCPWHPRSRKDDARRPGPARRCARAFGRPAAGDPGRFPARPRRPVARSPCHPGRLAGQAREPGDPPGARQSRRPGRRSARRLGNRLPGGAGERAAVRVATRAGAYPSRDTYSRGTCILRCTCRGQEDSAPPCHASTSAGTTACFPRSATSPGPR